MNKSEEIILTVGEHALRMDLVLAEYRDPILFTCVDEAGAMYLAACYRADGQERSWLIAETTPRTVLDLLRDRITIRNAFPSGAETVWTATLRRGEAAPAVRRCRAGELPEEIFPTPGMYMEGDGEEFREELAVLEARIRKSGEPKRPVPAAWERDLSGAPQTGICGYILPAFSLSCAARGPAWSWRDPRGKEIDREWRSSYGWSCGTH